MSADATGWVWKHSPYKGAGFIIHLALGDVANDAHGNRLFMRMSALAEKARVNRSTARNALDTMVADGYLKELVAPVGQKAGEYQFVTPHTSQTDEVVTPHTSQSDASHVTNAIAPLIGTKDELKPAPDQPGRGKLSEGDRITREWWESKNPRPMGSFLGARKIVQEALDRGWNSRQVAMALHRCDAVPARGQLARELKRQGPAGRTETQPEGYDQRPPEGGQAW